MRILVIIMFSLCFTVSYGQEFDGHKWKAPYELAVPKDWGVERFLIPISFAPAIAYKGVEDIRFAPGWGKAENENYWSYAILWYLDGKVKFEAKTIESNLKAYYTGLISVNGSKIPAEKIIPVETSFKDVKKDKGDIKTFEGTVRMLDYMQQKPIVLNCKVHLRSCSGENKTFVFYELSPQPFSHDTWKSMDKLWSGFNCTKQ